MATVYDNSLHLGNFTHGNGKVLVSDGSAFQAQSGFLLLSQSTGVSVNVGTKTTLYTVPAGKIAVVTAIIVRAPSVAVTTAVAGIGFNAGGNDVIATIPLGFLNTTTASGFSGTDGGARVGSATSILGMLCSVLEGTNTTISVDILGFLV